MVCGRQRSALQQSKSCNKILKAKRTRENAGDRLLITYGHYEEIAVRFTQSESGRQTYKRELSSSGLIRIQIENFILQPI